MSGFKRLCMFIFGLSGLACLALLVLPWYGMYPELIKRLLTHPVGSIAALCLAAITALGLLVCLLSALLAPRNPHSVIIAVVDGDEVQVSRDAIRAQAIHIIERDGTLTARSVSVKAKKRGHIRVFCRVQPNHEMNVVVLGEQLHERLMRGLAEICGDKIESVTLEFVDPVTHDAPLDFDSLEASYATTMSIAAPKTDGQDEEAVMDVSSEHRGSLPSVSRTHVQAAATEDIRVPMGSTSALRAYSRETERAEEDDASAELLRDDIPGDAREDA